MSAPEPGDKPAGGIWSLAGGEPIIVERDGPATVLVPTESVLLLAVDLPLASRTRRLEALPFAVEDRIADPLESVHLVLGAEIAPRRYLVGVVRHDVMARWASIADGEGLGHAAMVPDALALPIPAAGGWSVDLGATRAVVRSGDGTGFAVGAPLLRAAWEAAGRPVATGYGGPLPAEMDGGTAAAAAEPLARRLAAPALDLRQGPYARRAPAVASFWRRAAWIAGIGALAHVGIAAADTLMLGVIADRREAEFLKVATLAAPGVALGENPADTVADLLPRGAAPGATSQRFLPLLTRVSQALAPLAGAVTVRAMQFQADALVIDVAPGEPGLEARIGATLRAARVAATVTRSQDGSIRVTASDR